MHRTLFKAKDSDNAGVPLSDNVGSLREQSDHLSEDVIVGGLLKASAERTGTKLTDRCELRISANHPFGTSFS